MGSELSQPADDESCSQIRAPYNSSTDIIHLIKVMVYDSCVWWPPFAGNYQKGEKAKQSSRSGSPLPPPCLHWGPLRFMAGSEVSSSMVAHPSWGASVIPSPTLGGEVDGLHALLWPFPLMGSPGTRDVVCREMDRS